jgi:peptidyl-prolyl isomerase E (cyclophilin E)
MPHMRFYLKFACIDVLEMSQSSQHRFLHIAGLDDGVSSEVLLGAFSVFGEIRNIDIPIDNQSGKSRGFGFIEFIEEEDAKDAIDNMDESELYGRTIRVKFSTKKPPSQLLDPKQAVWADESYYKKLIARPLTSEPDE